MSIKIHLVLSFLLHSLILTYFLSLPIYKSSIDTLSFKGLFVYLQSEKGKETGNTSPAGKQNDSQEQVNEKENHDAAPIAQTIDNKKRDQREVASSKGQVVEIMREGVIEKKVFEAGEALQEMKGKPGYPQEEQQETDGIKDASLHAKKEPENTGNPSDEGVIVYEGTVLQTTPGFTIIPFEEAPGVEVLHARREEETEPQGEHAPEVLAKKEVPSVKEVEKGEKQEEAENLEARRDEMHEKIQKEIEAIKREIYKERGPLAEEAPVEVLHHEEGSKEAQENKEKPEPEKEALNEVRAEVEQPGEKHITEEEVQPEAQPEIETGLVIGSVQGSNVVPLEETSGGEPLPIEKQTEAKEKAQAKVEEQIEAEEMTEAKEEANVQIQAKEQLEAKAKAKAKEQIDKQKQVEAQVEVKVKEKKETGIETKTKEETLITENAETDISKVMKLHKETGQKFPAEVDMGLLFETMQGKMTIPFPDELPEDTKSAQQGVHGEEHGTEELESHEVGKESIQEPIEFEMPFDRSRVEEKLKYLESSIKEKDRKTKEKEIMPEETEQVMLTKKITPPDEKQGESGKPVAEIEKSPLKQEYQESDQIEKKKDTDLKRQDVDMQREEEQSEKSVAPDISEIKTGLLSSSVPGKTTVPFEEDLKRELPGETADERKELQEKASEEKPVEAVIERTVDKPIAVKTERADTSYEEHVQGGITAEEDTARGAEDALNQGEREVFSQQEQGEVLNEKEPQAHEEAFPELQGERIIGEKKPLLGISLPDAFFGKDIRIEISMKDPDNDEVSFHLIKKGHPLDEKRNSMREKEIELVEDTSMDYTEGYKRVFSTVKAEKGVYIFIIKNNGSKGYEADIMFKIFEGKQGERKKEYKTVALPPNTTLKYKFIIPEAVFWDDEDYFTGTIESSKTLTKYNEKTGLIWREEKDR